MFKQLLHSFISLGSNLPTPFDIQDFNKDHSPSLQLHATATTPENRWSEEHPDMEIQASIACSALKVLVEAIPDAVFFKDGGGRWLITNEAAKTLFKLDGVDWQGKTDQELGAERPEMYAIHEKCLEDDEATWNAGKLLVFDESIIDIAGNVHKYEVRKAPIFKANGERIGLIIIGRDITDRMLTERSLRVADTAIESLEAILITDKNNQILHVNKSFTRLTGYRPDEAIGKTPVILKSGRHSKEFYQAMWNTLTEKKFWQGELWDRRKNGEIYPKWLSITAVTGPDGEVHNYVGAFTDLSEHKEAEQAIHRLAFYDPLTDLPNRRLLNDHLDKALSSSDRNLQFGALLMIDLDNFKLINDTKGHAVGDLLLVEIAKCLKFCSREGDAIARLGGDEFVILLEFLGEDAQQAALKAEMVCKKILSQVDQPFLIDGQELHSTLSIGVSMFTMPNITREEMLKRADIAMYQAKSAGKNTMRFFDPGQHASLEKRMMMASELRQVLPENQLKLYYQAQVDHTHKILGAEVLLRWAHPLRGLVPPDEFIPIAEESGLIPQIGEWVMRTACLQLKMWESNPLTRDLTLAVNVSAKQFSQPDFVEQVCRVLEDTGAKGTLLKLELTETLMINNVTDTIKKMDALKLIGIRFSIDDFGTGYSSLGYLKRLPISQLKIDRSFVQDIDTNQNDAIIAKTIIGMANNLGFNVIAEGVETEAQRTTLERHGCLAYQGYLFSKPVPLDDFEKLLTNIREENNAQEHEC